MGYSKVTNNEDKSHPKNPKRKKRVSHETSANIIDSQNPLVC